MLIIDALNNDYGHGEGESLYDYLKMDWSDFNNDGSDDLVLCWDTGRDLAITVITSEVSNTNEVVFTGSYDFYLEGFTKSRSVRNVDTEDYDGDGFSDILMRHPKTFSNDVSVCVAINKSERFEMHKDVVITLKGADLLSSFSKYDSFDANSDGKADLIYVGEVNDIASMLIFPIQ